MYLREEEWYNCDFLHSIDTNYETVFVNKNKSQLIFCEK